MGVAGRVYAAIAGHAIALPPLVVQRFPELSRIRLRRGGILPRAAGWLLAQRSVAAVTLWRTVWVGPQTALSWELLLHEFCHVQQFETHRAFPLKYVREWLVHGYFRNRFEVDARHFAHAMARALRADHPVEDDQPW